jgi:ABC-type uncharacterized transport system substrate-binding protein
VNPLFEGLSERGWVDGQNIAFEFREGPDPQANATELVRLKVDVIVAVSSPPTLAAKAATQTIPIVFAANDTVEQGIVASLARPGGNLTGLEWAEMELAPKRVELLKEVMPRIKRVALLMDPDLSTARRWIAQTQAGGRALGIEIQPVEARVDRLGEAFARMTASRAEAVIIATSGRYWHERKRIAELAAKHRLPSMIDDRYCVVDGALMSYESATLSEALRLITKHVDRILRGAKPADLSVEFPTKSSSAWPTTRSGARRGRRPSPTSIRPGARQWSARRTGRRPPASSKRSTLSSIFRRVPRGRSRSSTSI